LGAIIINYIYSQAPPPIAYNLI